MLSLILPACEPAGEHPDQRERLHVVFSNTRSRNANSLRAEAPQMAASFINLLTCPR